MENFPNKRPRDIGDEIIDKRGPTPLGIALVGGALIGIASSLGHPAADENHKNEAIDNIKEPSAAEASMPARENPLAVSGPDAAPPVVVVPFPRKHEEIPKSNGEFIDAHNAFDGESPAHHS